MSNVRQKKKARLSAKQKPPHVLGISGFDPSSVLRDSLKGKLPEAEDGLDKLLATVATNIWRVFQRVMDVETCEPKPEMKRVHRHIDAINDALKEFGVEIIDHTGQRYDTGSALKVITSEKRAGLNREEVIETLKPTVRFQGRLLQLGEVVVGEPVSQSGIDS